MSTHNCIFFFFFNDTATTEIYTLSLHDALPIYAGQATRQDLAALRQEPAQRAVVLVVEHADPGLAHGARLRGASHASSSSSSSSSVAITAAAGAGLAGRPSDTTTRNRSTPSSSLTARSYSGSSSAAASNCATT